MKKTLVILWFVIAAGALFIISHLIKLESGVFLNFIVNDLISPILWNMVCFL